MKQNNTISIVVLVIVIAIVGLIAIIFGLPYLAQGIEYVSNIDYAKAAQAIFSSEPVKALLTIAIIFGVIMVAMDMLD